VRLGQSILRSHLHRTNRECFDFSPFTSDQWDHRPIRAQVLHGRSSWCRRSLALQALEFGGLFGGIGSAGRLGVPPQRCFLQLDAPKEGQLRRRLFERHARAQAHHALGQRGAQLVAQQAQFFIQGKKTGSTRGADCVATVQVQRRAVARWTNSAALAPARLQLAATRRATRSLRWRLSCQIGGRARLNHFSHRLRLELLHGLDDRRLDLRQCRLRVRSPADCQFLRYRLARRLPPRQDLLDLVLAHSIPPATISAGRSVTLPDYAKLRRAPCVWALMARALAAAARQDKLWRAGPWRSLRCQNGCTPDVWRAATDL
jgi:hypothetical protein